MKKLIIVVLSTISAISILGCNNQLTGNMGLNQLPPESKVSAAEALTAMWDGTNNQSSEIESAIHNYLLVDENQTSVPGLSKLTSGASQNTSTQIRSQISNLKSGQFNKASEFWQLSQEDALFPAHIKSWLASHYTQFQGVSNSCAVNSNVPLAQEVIQTFQPTDEQAFCDKVLESMPNASSMFKGICKSLVDHSKFEVKVKSSSEGELAWKVKYGLSDYYEVARLKFNSCDAPGLLVGKFEAKTLLATLKYALADEFVGNYFTSFIANPKDAIGKALYLVTELMLGEADSIGATGTIYFAFLKSESGAKAENKFWLTVKPDDELSFGYVKLGGSDCTTCSSGVDIKSFLTFFRPYKQKSYSAKYDSIIPPGTLFYGTVQEALQNESANIIANQVNVWRPTGAISMVGTIGNNSNAQFREVNGKIKFDFDFETVELNDLLFGYQAPMTNIFEASFAIYKGDGTAAQKLFPTSSKELPSGLYDDVRKESVQVASSIQCRKVTYSNRYSLRLASMVVRNPIDVRAHFSKYNNYLPGQSREVLLMINYDSSKPKNLLADFFVNSDFVVNSLVRMRSTETISLNYIVNSDHLFFKGGEIEQVEIRIPTYMKNDFCFQPNEENWQGYLEKAEALTSTDDYMLQKFAESQPINSTDPEVTTTKFFDHATNGWFENPLNAQVLPDYEDESNPGYFFIQNGQYNFKVAKTVWRKYGRIGYTSALSNIRTEHEHQFTFTYKNLRLK